MPIFMIQQIKDLEASARLLEPTARVRNKVRQKTITYTEKFINNLPSANAYNTSPDNGIALLNSPISQQPIAIDEAINLIKENIDTPGLNPASGKNFGYIPGGGIYYSSLADYIAAISNRYAGVFFASPGAVRMENMLINWLASLAGYPATASGNLASGGSIANLTAIVTARETHQLKARNFHNTVVYLSQHTHHCIEKSLRVAGLGECIKKYIPLDSQHRIIPKALEEIILQDIAQGLCPWLIVASAGTTDIGSVDPLDAIGDIAQKHKLWFHIDGAYGAFFLLTKAGKEKLKGIEKSDSLVMDPHKSLFLPYGTGVVLVKNKQHLQAAHSYQANYMQDTLIATEETSPADLSPELTKHFRGLRMWLPLKLLGLKPFQAALEEKLLLANYFYQQLKKIKGFELGPEPELSVVTYRYVPQKGDVNAFNKALVNAIQQEGTIFISSTTINGQFILRLAVLSFRTHLKEINLTLKLLKKHATLLEKQQN